MHYAIAQVQFARGFIGRGDEINLRPGDESGSWTVEQTDYSAPEPRGPETFTVEHESTPFDGEWQIAGRELHVPLAPYAPPVPFRKGGDPAAAAKRNPIEMLLAHCDSPPPH